MPTPSSTAGRRPARTRGGGHRVSSRSSVTAVVVVFLRRPRSSRKTTISAAANQATTPPRGRGLSGVTIIARPASARFDVAGCDEYGCSIRAARSRFARGTKTCWRPEVPPVRYGRRPRRSGQCREAEVAGSLSVPFAATKPPTCRSAPGSRGRRLESGAGCSSAWRVMSAGRDTQHFAQVLPHRRRRD